jgi:hypothetical protein
MAMLLWVTWFFCSAWRGGGSEGGADASPPGRQRKPLGVISCCCAHLPQPAAPLPPLLPPSLRSFLLVLIAALSAFAFAFTFAT